MNLLFYLSILPAIILGKYVYTRDKVEKEPAPLLVKLFLLGIAAIALTLFISLIVELFFPSFRDEPHGILNILIYYFFGIALIEEFSKWIMLYLGSWNNDNFDYQYDGLIYAVFVSLGFATVENIMYVSSGGLIIAIFRAILSVPGHVFFAVFMGYYYALAKKAERKKENGRRNKYLYFSLLVPMILHGIYDSTVMICSDYDSYISWLFLAIYLIFIVVLYVVSFRKINELSDIKSNIDDLVTRDIPIINNQVYCKECGSLVNNMYCANCGAKTILYKHS